jgi:hypothetical protein
MLASPWSTGADNTTLSRHVQSGCMILLALYFLTVPTPYTHPMRLGILCFAARKKPLSPQISG